MKIRTEDEIKERIKIALTEEMNVVNNITQGKPQQWVPQFVNQLTSKLHEICIDEIRNRRRF